MSNKKNHGRFLKQNVEKRICHPTQPMPQTTPKKAPKKAPKKQSSKAPQTGTIAKSVIVFTVLALCVSVVASVFFLGKLGFSFSLPSNTIAKGVKVAGVFVGEMTKNEAEEIVAATVGDSYTTTPMVVEVMDKQLQIDPSVSGAQLDVKAAVREAMGYGTQENPAKVVDIIPHLNLNTEAIRNIVTQFSSQFPTEGINGGYEIVKETVDGKDQAVLTITIGTEYYDYDPDALYDIIIKAYNGHKFETSYDCKKISSADIDLDGIYEETCTEAVNATWDSQTHEIVESQIGYQFDLEAAKAAVASAKPGDVLKFPYLEVLPEIDTDSIEEVLFRDTLGTYTAKSGSSYNRDTNLRLACEAISGLVIYPGEVFSYNEALGERTPEKGYKPANTYMGDQTVQSYGGGICQPSSSLYYCAMLADLEIVERRYHGFVSSYMPYGMDATVSWGGPDFKFRNNTNYPIRIDAEADGGTVIVTLVGTDEKDYYVEMEYEILSVTDYKTVEKEVEPGSGHRDGEVETSPYTGYTVQTYKCKYDKETDELISREKEAYSNYSKRDKVVYKIKDKVEETKPTEPKPTEPAPTDPKPTEPVPETTEPAPTEPAPTEPVSPPVGEAGGDVDLPSE